MSAQLLVNSLKDIKDNKALDRYDENLCADIHQRLNKSLKENGYGIAERTKFAQQNIVAMEKWNSVFPEGVSRCLKEYFNEHYSWAPKFDARFPNQNQARRCFVNFVDYQRCLKIKGSDAKECDYFKLASNVLCPDQWREKWNEQLESGSFPVKI